MAALRYGVYDIGMAAQKNTTNRCYLFQQYSE